MGGFVGARPREAFRISGRQRISGHRHVWGAPAVRAKRCATVCSRGSRAGWRSALSPSRCTPVERHMRLIGVDEGRVAMGNSVSSLLGLVAASIPDGARVATVRGEYTSVTFPFAAQVGRGVTVTELTSGRLEDAAGEFDVVVASLVQSADGAVLDVETLCRSIAESDTVTVIDVAQALGWKNVELSWADVAVAPSYKWLLGPRGVAWMSLSERVA
jgi:selenocysteine lyase/cysteine desulfurase